jgi:hypothetical protein
MLAILITIVAGASTAILVELRNTGERRPMRPSKRRFRAVSIVPMDGMSCCSVCDPLGTRRFLLHEAPKLPIAGCTAPACTCRYRHHLDRRRVNPGRRVPDFGQSQPLYDGLERRLWDVSRRRRPSRRAVRI